jgi:hypothetical protein
VELLETAEMRWCSGVLEWWGATQSHRSAGSPHHSTTLAPHYVYLIPPPRVFCTFCQDREQKVRLDFPAGCPPPAGGLVDGHFCY